MHDYETSTHLSGAQLGITDDPSHKMAGPATPILIGAGVGFVAGGLSAGYAHNWESQAMWKGAGIGAVSGAVAVATTGKSLLYNIALNGFVSLATDVASQVIIENKSLHELDSNRMLLSIETGYLSAGAGHLAGNFALAKTSVIGSTVGSNVVRQKLRETVAGVVTGGIISTSVGILAGEQKCTSHE
ncbi:MAG: hypothetical protein KDD68_01045 [Bdellovibrionales bacterium]|nr:hypothetical protein [Bdellovibrionales bacterium]